MGGEEGVAVFEAEGDEDEREARAEERPGRAEARGEGEYARAFALAAVDDFDRVAFVVERRIR